ncbi:MAG: iron chelate uptake ABC transporter family permease subunit, partial [Bacteroidota bacterium]|nr:iron chelate uptake ABC transporter family permease subunit [Bacteroidota bacterium]
MLAELFEYKFIVNSLLAGIFASISCGIIGTYIVTRRMVFLSGGITHASFGGIGIGYYFGFNPVIAAAVFAVFSALGIELLSKKSDVRQDSVIGILWSLGMAIGIIFIFITPGYAPNLMTYLFGSILTVSTLDIILMAIISVVIILIFIFFYHIILFVAYDQEFAQTHKLPVNFINNLLISLVALTIVLNIKVVGIILVISLLTIPQSIANLFTNEFKNIIILSIVIGLVGALMGLLISYQVNIPSGASIIFSLVMFFLL